MENNEQITQEPDVDCGTFLVMLITILTVIGLAGMAATGSGFIGALYIILSWVIPGDNVPWSLTGAVALFLAGLIVSGGCAYLLGPIYEMMDGPNQSDAG
jgi:hypothetical protein